MPEKIEESPLRRISREMGDHGLFPPEVHRLYEAGSARKAQAALRSHVSKEANSGRKRRQQQYLDDPYLWLEPLKKAPSLHTVNGIGTMLYGHYKPSPEGLYVATLWFVLVFIPVFPISAYVVRKASGNSWNFYAKAPLPPFARLWRLGFGAVTVLIAGAIAASVMWDRAHTELWVYNGFETPVDVQVEEDSYTVRPHGLVRAGEYAIGSVHVVATPEGWAVPIEELDLDLGLTSDTWLYNVAGRASLVRGWIVYGPGDPPEDQLLGTDRLVDVGDVDYLFRDPPESKQVREGSKITDQVVYNAEDEVPLTIAVLYTQNTVDTADAWTMLGAELAVDPGDQEAMALALAFLEPGAEALLEVGELARTARPDDVEAHRLYQNVLGPDRSLEARASYAALADEHAGQPMYQYLAGRLQPDGSPDAAAYFDKALELDEGYAYAHLAQGYNRATQGDLPGAMASYDRYAASGNVAFAQSLRPRVRLLQARGESGWRARAVQLMDQAESQLGTDYGTANLRACMHAWHDPSTLDAAIERLSLDLAASSPGPDELVESMVVAELEAVLAAGAAERARALMAEMDPEQAAHSIAKGELFLALAAADGDALGTVLDNYADVLTMHGSTLTLLTAAAAKALEHPSAADLAEAASAIERAGSVNPTVVLEAGANLTTPEALDTLLSPVALDSRGFGYAAAVALLQHGRGADEATLRHAKDQARRLLLPDETPHW